MKIVTEHLINIASNLEKKIEKITVDIEKIDNVIYVLSGLNMENIVIELSKNKERLFQEREKILRLTEVIYISLNYYVKWDEYNASYCYEDSLMYGERKTGVINLLDIKNVLESMED